MYKFAFNFNIYSNNEWKGKTSSNYQEDNKYHENWYSGRIIKVVI